MMNRKYMKKLIAKGISISLCAVLLGGTVSVSAAKDNVLLTKSESETESRGKGKLDVSDIVEDVMPSVVAITTQSVQEVIDYYGMFGYGGYAPETEEVEGSGSGIIIGENDDELLVVTNYHVVEGAKTLSVGFVDGNAYEAKVKGFDENRDLAVVSVSKEDISDDTYKEIAIAKIGNSDSLAVGEQVVAIGNALGYGQSVTTGIVSAKNRKINGASGVVQKEDSISKGVNVIQTDAAINPGNSGGALLNMNGEVVGINSAKLASTEVEGMGYAIAITDIEGVLENLMNEEAREKLEDSEHGVLGIMGSTVSQEAINMYGIPEGVFISEVNEGGAAEKAGMKKNWVITEFDGRTISGIEQLVELLSYYKPGEEIEVKVEVQSGDGYTEEVITVVLGENTNAKEDDQEAAEDEEIVEEKPSKPSEDEEDDENSDDEDVFDKWFDEDEFTEEEKELFEEWKNRILEGESQEEGNFFN